MASASAAPSYAFGTYHRLFNAQSLWNCKPVNPVFSMFSIYFFYKLSTFYNKNSNIFFIDATARIPTDMYYPSIAQGEFSVALFRAFAKDGPMVVYGKTNANTGKLELKNVDNLEVCRFLY